MRGSTYRISPQFRNTGVEPIGEGAMIPHLVPAVYLRELQKIYEQYKLNLLIT